MAAQEFTGLSVISPGYTILESKLKEGDRIIVSMVLAEFMVTIREYDSIMILCSGSSPKNGVRDGHGTILGTKALEYYAPKKV